MPQILHYLGVFEYSEELQKAIKDQEVIPHAHQMEIEIRALTVECINVCVSDYLKPSTSTTSDTSEDRVKSGKPLLSIELDWILWQMGEQNLDKLQPHHRTLSIFY